MNMKTKKTITALVALTVLFSAGAAKTSFADCNNTPGYASPINQGEFVQKNQAYFDIAHLDAYVQIVDYMRDQVSPDDFKNYYLPIKIAAATAKIMLNAHGVFSSQTHNALLGLVNSIGQANGQLNTLLSIQAYYQTAVDLLTLQENLKSEMN